MFASNTLESNYNQHFTNKMSFKFILIPADNSKPIQTLTASKDGGLSDDALSKYAKDYFYTLSGGANRAKILNEATDEERKQIAQSIRNQYANTPSAESLNKMGDEALLELIKTSESSGTCEITCLTVPTPINNHRGVSMYGDDNARNRNYLYNQRATDLMKACGHAFPQDTSLEDGKPNGIYGDVFVGRCHDDEVKDIWERVDFMPDEAEGDLSQKEWIKIAIKKGGGGGHGGSAASLSNTLSNIGKSNNGMNPTTGALAAESGEIQGDGFSWSQTDEEVEIKIKVAKNIKAKHVKVKFGKKSLKVTSAGQTLIDGETWAEFSNDDSTFTIQDDNESGGRELCVTLGKKEAETWNYAVVGK
jgi:hypothetical protein